LETINLRRILRFSRRRSR